MAMSIKGVCSRENCHYPEHSLPPNRVVKIDGNGDLQLAGATDENAIGFTAAGLYERDALPRTYHDAIELEIAAGNTIASGDVVNQADDGKIQSGGTVRVGVAIRGGSGGDLALVMPH